jgi:hypothetical protein
MRHGEIGNRDVGYGITKCTHRHDAASAKGTLHGPVVGSCTCTRTPKRPTQTSFLLDCYKAAHLLVGGWDWASPAADVVVIVMVIVGFVIEFAAACFVLLRALVPDMRILISDEGHAACVKTRQQARPGHALSSVPSQCLSIWINRDRASVA